MQMKIQHILCVVAVTALFMGCESRNGQSDAFGTFEADEVIVSSEVSGKILSLNIEEGSLLKKDSVVGVIDSVPILLQKAQMLATIGALKRKTMDVKPQIRLLQDQITVQEAQLDNALHEKARTERLVRAEAATTKQLDDINTQIDVLQKQITVTSQRIKVQETTTGNQNSIVMSEYKPLRKSLAQIDDQLQRAFISNPTNGVVLTKYAMAGEMTAAGKALYKIADLSTITLRAYITGTQMAQIKLNQEVTVLVDSNKTKYRKYTGIVSMISDQAEFTPKTIQTKDERANLVYAIKIHVKNDGFLKIGMYGEVKFN
jgi:HlyD family secretion protein